MGLDMYLHKRTKGEEIGYWRKHNRLHGWMEHLWETRGNTEVFNCVDLVLYKEDLDTLENVIKGKDLPSTKGFFFGGDSYNHYDADMQQEDLNIIKNAKQAIKDGYDIVYSCWW